MHTLFNLAPSLAAPVMYAPQWNYIRSGMKQNLDRVIRYYRQNAMAVPSQHLIVRLLSSLSVIPVSHNLERYFDNVDAVSLNQSMALKMTSSIFKGSLFKGVFYADCPEIIIAHDTDFDVQRADKEWENVCPVRVLRHPWSDLKLALPDGKYKPDATWGVGEVAVIAVNIPMLAVQYRAWQRREWEYSALMGDSPRSIMQFVHMYVLPNMLFSQTDYAIFNRLYNGVRDMPAPETNSRAHSFYITDFGDRVDTSQDAVLANLAKVGRSFTGILRNIPAATKTDMDEVMTLPEVAPTRQVEWALAMARLPAVRLMLMLSKWSPKFRNQQELNKLRQSIRSFQSNNVMKSMLPADMAREVDGLIQSMLDDTTSFATA